MVLCENISSGPKTESINTETLFDIYFNRPICLGHSDSGIGRQFRKKNWYKQMHIT